MYSLRLYHSQLLAVSFLGYVADLTDLDEHFLVYVANVVPAPYTSASSADFSNVAHTGSDEEFLRSPGILALIFFPSRLFAVLIPAFPHH